ncbi:MAG: Kelch repeat-containing protein [Fimbriimonas sp.]
MSSDTDRNQFSRRDVLAGVVAIGAAAALPTLASARHSESKEKAFERDSMLLHQGMPSRTCHSSTPLQNGLVLVVGGFIADRATTSAVLLDPSTGAYENVAPMRTARARHAAVALNDGRVVVLGGFNRSFSAAVEIYDPFSNRWTSLERLPSQRADFTAVLSSNGILLIGGTGPINSPGIAMYSIFSQV